jgi:acylphosphatase
MASAFGVTGWVRNLPDGRVEVVAEGERDRVELLTQWCRRGPDTALVEAVDVLEEPYKGEFQMFTIERTLR